MSRSSRETGSKPLVGSSKMSSCAPWDKARVHVLYLHPRRKLVYLLLRVQSEHLQIARIGLMIPVGLETLGDLSNLGEPLVFVEVHSAENHTNALFAALLMAAEIATEHLH